MKKNKLCSLSMDFSNVDIGLDLWIKKREKKQIIFNELGEYIEILNESLIYEQDFYQKYLIEQEIKRVTKEQTKYYVEPLLGVHLNEEKFDENLTEVERKKTLEKSPTKVNKKKRNK